MIRRTPCTLDVRPRATAGECEATVACGATQLYPRDGDGSVTCEIHDGLIVRAHGSSELDPTLELDVGRGTLTISEVQPAWWSVALHVPPS